MSFWECIILQVASSVNVGCCAVLGSSFTCGFPCSIYSAAPSTSTSHQSSVKLSSICLEQCCELYEIPLAGKPSLVPPTLVFNTKPLRYIKELKLQMLSMCIAWLILTDIHMRNKRTRRCCVCVSHSVVVAVTSTGEKRCKKNLFLLTVSEGALANFLASWLLAFSEQKTTHWQEGLIM